MVFASGRTGGMTVTSPYPASGGTYILLVELASPVSIAVGKLGAIRFEKGVYAYVGSALGPGGLTARLGRYGRGPRRKHWHIDYLLEHGKILGTVTRRGSDRRECCWAEWIGPQTLDSVPGFGSSDCRCGSHLFFVGNHSKSEELMAAAGCELTATARSEVSDGL